MNLLISLGAICAGLAVALGAFAAHGLKSKLSEAMLAVFQTGVQYQFYHSLALLILVLLYRQYQNGLLLWSYGFMLAGIVLFSGSLYMLALTSNKIFGPVTPIGGLCFLIGWIILAIAGFRMEQ